ncbi:MAG: ribonuclease Z [Lachnospiraceae bacterium]|nr:ribonuclease Z [Lachnospiraceae bacterium]
MFDITLLGTGGMMPLPYRYLTSLMARYDGGGILIDCGEATQCAMRKKALSPKGIDAILFTHFHADHISGLPGMMLSLANAERTEPVLVAGPKGLERIVRSLLVIAQGLPFEIRFHELEGSEDAFDVGGMHVKAFRVNHNVTCYGYSIEVARAGRFNAEEAKRLGIPLQLWNPLQKGNTCTDDEGNTYTPDMVMGEPRKGLKVTYVTDTRPTASIAENAKDSDLFICEGMYGDPANLDKAKEKKHMIYSEAAKLAKDAGVKELWLTHYSPSMNDPREYLHVARGIFPDTVAAKDGRTKELKYEEAE